MVGSEGAETVFAAAVPAVAPSAPFCGPLDGQGRRTPCLHDYEGDDDMPAHIRTALKARTMALSVESGRLLLGTWQGIYLWEHRVIPHRRLIACHLMGD